jgi:hypothetical protein
VTPSVHQVLSLCNVNLVDGLVWNEEAARSNRAMETKVFLKRGSDMKRGKR